MEQRVRTQKLKDKRKAALDARLAKVRERKLKKLKASGELDEESNEDSGQTEGKEEKLLGNVGQPTTEQDVKGGLPDRENDDVVSVQKAELPEWAQHKISKSTALCNCTVLIQWVSMSPTISFSVVWFLSWFMYSSTSPHLNSPTFVSL